MTDDVRAVLSTFPFSPLYSLDHPRDSFIIFMKAQKRLNTSCDHLLKQVVRDALDAFVRALLGYAVPRWVDMSGRTGQSVGPPNGGGIKDDVVLRPIVESGAVLAHGFSIDGGIAFRDDAHAGQVHGRGPVPLPSQ